MTYAFEMESDALADVERLPPLLKRQNNLGLGVLAQTHTSQSALRPATPQGAGVSSSPRTTMT